MTITTLSSREFNLDTSRAKKAAKDGPVFITGRGIPAHVLLSIEEYERLTGTQGSTAWACPPASRTLNSISRRCMIPQDRLFHLMFLLDTNVISELGKVRSGKPMQM